MRTILSVAIQTPVEILGRVSPYAVAISPHGSERGRLGSRRVGNLFVEASIVLGIGVDKLHPYWRRGGGLLLRNYSSIFRLEATALFLCAALG